jgi:hypothetical protein
MVELETKEREGRLTDADLATFGILPKLPGSLPPVEVQAEEIALIRKAPIADPLPLFSQSELEEFQSQWSSIRAGFVDEPRRRVEDADRLVGAVMRHLTSGFASERSGLDAKWNHGDDVSTEDLRMALQRYCAFFEKLLAL